MEACKIVVELIQVVNFCMPVCFCAFVSESCLVTSSTLFVSIPFFFSNTQKFFLGCIVSVPMQESWGRELPSCYC